MEPKIWITSDTHFCHNKDFVWQPRGFNSVQEMNEEIVKRWNSVVAPNDIVYHLGDVMLNDNEKGIRLLNQCYGDIRILTGNHDTATRIKEYANIRPTISPIGFATVIKHKGYSFYLSHYPTITSNHDADKPLKRRVINLCGHSHTADPFADWEKGLIFHCEVDTKTDCSPWLLDDIIKDIKEKLNE